MPIISNLPKKTLTQSIADSRYIQNTTKGQADGVAELDSTGKVPSVQLPSMDYIPTSEKGTASGVATLGSDGKLTVSQRPAYTASEVGAIPASQKGANNGVAELDSTGRVPSSQLPSYVDDVLEYDSSSSFPQTGEDGKIYVAEDTNRQYRWSGSGYIEISPSLALGETSATAYRGDRGAAAYAHSQASGNPHNTTAADIGAVPTSRTVNGKALNGDISLSAADVGARPASWTPTAEDVGAVPTSRTVNGQALSGNVTLNAGDVGAVPTSRTINGHALSTNITLDADDVGAATTADVEAAMPLYVTIGGTDGNYTTDTTAPQIIAAYEAGRAAFAVVSLDNTPIIAPLVMVIAGSMVQFSGAYGSSSTVDIQIMDDLGSPIVMVYTTDVAVIKSAITIPTSGWSNNQQTFTVNGVPSDPQNHKVDLATVGATNTQAMRDAGLYIVDEAANSLTLGVSTVPTASFQVYATITPLL